MGIKRTSAGTIASVSTLGMILPPCTVLIIYGLQVEQSIGRLFLAGIVPSLMIAALFMAVIAGWVIARPAIAPRAEKASWKERFAVIPDAVIVGIIFGIVIGGMITGFFSPTESGTIGTVSIFFLALARREVNTDMIIRSFKGALKTSIMTLMLIAGSAIFGHFLAITEIPMIAAKWAGGLPCAGLCCYAHNCCCSISWVVQSWMTWLSWCLPLQSFPYSHRTRLRSYMVRHPYLRYPHDWWTYSAGSHLCFYFRKHNGTPFKTHLQSRSFFVIPCSGFDTPVCLPSDCTLIANLMMGKA